MSTVASMDRSVRHWAATVATRVTTDVRHGMDEALHGIEDVRQSVAGVRRAWDDNLRHEVDDMRHSLDEMRHSLDEVRHALDEVRHGLDAAVDVVLSPFAVDFTGWTFGDQSRETWM